MRLGRALGCVVLLATLAVSATAQTTAPGLNTPAPTVNTPAPTIRPTTPITPNRVITPQQIQRPAAGAIRTGPLEFIASTTPPPARGATSTVTLRTGELAFIASTTPPPVAGTTTTVRVRTGELAFVGAP